MITADRTYRALIEALTRMQTQLDDLAYLLEVHTLVIGSGSIDAVQRTTRDIEAATLMVVDSERRCGELTDQLVGRAGSSLGELIDRSDEPWRGLLDHHRNALGAAHVAVADLASTAQRAAKRAARRQRDTYVAAVGSPTAEYSAGPAPLPQRALLLDRSV
ncbi:MAG: hypothetical protein ACOYMR_04625 [Ilumatobacteraceae bacterium]